MGQIKFRNSIQRLEQTLQGVDILKGVGFNVYESTTGRVPDAYAVWSWGEIVYSNSSRHSNILSVDYSVGVYVNNKDRSVVIGQLLDAVDQVSDALVDQGFRVRIGPSVYDAENSIEGCQLFVEARF